MRATELGLSDPEFSSVLSLVIRKLPAQKLTVLPTPFRRDWLAWIGGSVFASIKVLYRLFFQYIARFYTYLCYYYCLKSNYRRFVRVTDLKKAVIASSLPLNESVKGALEEKAAVPMSSPRSSAAPVSVPVPVNGPPSVPLSTSYVCPDWQSLDPSDWLFWGPNRSDSSSSSEAISSHSHSHSPSRLGSLLSSQSSWGSRDLAALSLHSPRRGSSANAVGIARQSLAFSSSSSSSNSGGSGSGSRLSSPLASSSSVGRSLHFLSPRRTPPRSSGGSVSYQKRPGLEIGSLTSPLPSASKD